MNIPLLNSVAVSGVITALGGGSTEWNDAYTNLVTNSAAYLLSGTDVNLGDIPTLSGNWNSVYSTVQAFSASWDADVGSTATITSNTLTLNLTGLSYFQVSLDSSITTITLLNPKPAPQVTSFVLQLIADGTVRSVVWPVSIKWPGGIAPTISNTLNAVDTFTFFTSDAGTIYYGFPTGYSS